MSRGDRVPADQETFNLHLKTSSTAESGDKTLIRFNDVEGGWAGGFGILFHGTIKYRVLECQDRYKLFPASVPSESDKEWVIEKRSYTIRVYCNGEQVLEMEVSAETCTNPSYEDVWETDWGRRVGNIKFSAKHDTATKSYCIGR